MRSSLEGEPAFRTECLFRSTPRHYLARPVLIMAITSMVLISIQPFAFKKIFLLVAALLCLSSAICLADSLFMSLHSAPYGRQLNRLRPVPLSVPERTVRPPLPIACQSLDGRFAQESERILPETFVLNPTINWLTPRSGNVGQRPYISLCTYAGGLKYHAASSALWEKN
jgi:hypothetical protein